MLKGRSTDPSDDGLDNASRFRSEGIVENTVFAFHHFRINSSSRTHAQNMDAGEPSYNTGDTLHTERAFTSNLGIFFAVFFLIIILSYGSYIYRRSIRSQSSLPPFTSFEDTVHSDNDDSTGLDDDVLATLPTILYSEVVIFPNGETNTATHADNCGSAGCSICLADYKQADVIRLLPECSHLFHVNCVDTWLRVHPTCPVCRNSPLPTPADLT